MSDATELKKTPLYEEHVRLGGKIVDFAGWLLPIQYPEGILKEHENVRTSCGLFDVSHMGEVWVSGPETLKFCEYLIPTNVSRMKFGEICYSCFCNEAGGIVDDLLLYKKEEKRVLLVVNASNVDKDVAWIKARAKGFDVSIENASSEFAQIAIQGPDAEKIVQPFASVVLSEIEFYHFVVGRVNGIEGIISRTGYTGEDGFEVYTANSADIVDIWHHSLIEGESYGIKPCGLGARDTTRFEVAYWLYGNDIDEHINPLETGQEWAVKFDKEKFIGKDSLLKIKQEGITRQLVGLFVPQGGIPRNKMEVYKDNHKIGFITSGNYCPSLKKVYAMALLDLPFTKVGTQVDIMIRNKAVPAEVVPLPFLLPFNKR